MSDNTVCACCDKPGHIAEHRKAPFRKRWPGKSAVKMTLRNKDGATIDFTGDISEQVYTKLGEALNEALTAAFPKEPS
jgi:hypothetical protein